MMLLHTGDHRLSSWSLRPWLLMKMAGMAFAVSQHAFWEDARQQRTAWRAFSPTGKVPVLEDGETRVWDSLAICLYIAERCPQVWPDDAAARAWAYAATAEMHSGFPVLRRDCPFRTTPADTVVSAALAAELCRISELWTQGLQRFGGAYLAGARFGVVDAFYAPVVFRVHYYGLAGRFDAAAQRYMARIMALPAVREWQADADARPGMPQP